MSIEQVKISDVCEVVGGTTPSTSVPDYWDGDVTWLSPVDLPAVGTIVEVTDSKRKITSKALAETSLRMLPVGSVVYSTRASIGKIGHVMSPLVTNQGFTNMIPGPKVNNRYLAYVLKYFTPQFELLGNSTTFNEVSRTAIKNFKIPLSPLAEQIHIAQVLDQADRLRQQDRQLLAHYDQLVQAVFMDMFGTANLESKDWPEVRIADLANPGKNSMRTGPFGSDLLHSEFVDEGIFVLGIDNVVNNSFEWAKPRFITTEKYEKLKRYTVFPGDVLISIMATIGRTAVVPDDVPAAINSKHLAAITLNQKLAIPSFISYSLYADPKILKQLAARSKGAIMDGLNLGIIKDTKLNLPPLALQQRFAEILNQIEAQKAATQQLQAQSEALFNSLLQRAFRGELTRPEPVAGAAAGAPAGQLALALE